MTALQPAIATRRPAGRRALPARPLPARQSQAAETRSTPSSAPSTLSPGLIPAREELAELYDALGRQPNRARAAAGARRPRPRRRSSGRSRSAWRTLAPGQADLAVLTLGQRARTHAGPAAGLRRARPRLARHRRRAQRRPGRAAPRRSKPLERAASAPTATERGTDAVRPRAAATIRRARGRRARPPAGDGAIPSIRPRSSPTRRAPSSQNHLDSRADGADRLRTRSSADDADSAARAARIGALSHAPSNDPRCRDDWLQRATTGRARADLTLAGRARRRAAARRRPRSRAQVTVARGLDREPENARTRCALAQRIERVHCFSRSLTLTAALRVGRDRGARRRGN